MTKLRSCTMNPKTDQRGALERLHLEVSPAMPVACFTLSHASPRLLPMVGPVEAVVPVVSVFGWLGSPAWTDIEPTETSPFRGAANDLNVMAKENAQGDVQASKHRFWLVYLHGGTGSKP